MAFPDSRTRFFRGSLTTLLFFFSAAILLAQPYDLVIANGRVMDPETGLDAIRHVGILEGTIRAVSEAPLIGGQTIDATGFVVAPGFIDLNTYEHGDPFFRLRVADGATSVLHLEDGAVDVDAYYRTHEGRALVHYGTAVGHRSLRAFATDDPPEVTEDGFSREVASELDRRPLTESELERLAELVERGLEAGAVAVGFGIEYTPGATHSEILRIFEVAEAYGASSHLHVRDFHETLEWSQLYEIFGGALHTRGDFHVNHLQSIFGSYSGSALAFIERARAAGLSVTAECYPYTAGSTFIESALFDDWENREDDYLARFEWAETGERLTRESFAEYRRRGGIVIIHPRDPMTQEAAVRTCLAHPLTMVASDGAWDGGKTHPRSAGTASRVLGRYVREHKVLSLMEALRKMSLAPALHLVIVACRGCAARGVCKSAPTQTSCSSMPARSSIARPTRSRRFRPRASNMSSSWERRSYATVRLSTASSLAKRSAPSSTVADLAGDLTVHAGLDRRSSRTWTPTTDARPAEGTGVAPFTTERPLGFAMMCAASCAPSEHATTNSLGGRSQGKKQVSSVMGCEDPAAASEPAPGRNSTSGRPR